MKFLSKRKKITEVDYGDLILSCDIQNQQDVYRKVKNIMRPIVEHEHQVRITSSSGAILITSDTHPTAINEEGIIKYIKGGDVTTDDYVVSNTNKKEKVINVDCPKVSTQYADFSIDEHENYYAGMNPDKLLLAHNSCTVYYPIWHYQFDDLIVLKNNQGTEETRVRHMDYAVVMSALFWRRFKNKENITFFDPNEVPDLYEAFYSDIDLFEELYVKYEKRKDLRKKVMSAEEVFKGGLLKERTDFSFPAVEPRNRLLCVSVSLWLMDLIDRNHPVFAELQRSGFLIAFEGADEICRSFIAHGKRDFFAVHPGIFKQMAGVDDFPPGNKFIRRDAGLLLENPGKMFPRNIEF